MAIEIKVELEALRSLGFASIGAAYMGIGTPLENPARMLLLQNFTDADLMFSFDGITDNLPLRAYSSFIWDIAANKTIDSGFFVAQGTRVYVKELGTPIVGSVYISAFFGSQD